MLAFFIGGLVILITGHNPISTYKAIFNGTGLNWFFPWVTGDERATAALNLQQTLITTTPLILTGLAVAFAFRCGLFNIGGQGQYLVGSYVAVWVGSSFAGMPRLLHVVLAMVARHPGRRGLGGDRRAAEGGGRCPRGDLDDHAQLDRGVGGRLPVRARRAAAELRPAQQSVPVSSDVAASAKLPVFWGDPELQGLHIGIFIALAARRRLLGPAQPLDHRLRGARGRLQPRGRPLRRHQRLAQLHPGDGRMRRLRRAGGVGGPPRLAVPHRHQRHPQLGNVGWFFGIAVALLGRNTASGTVVAALLFGALLTGTSQRNLDPTIFEPELAGNLTLIIQGLVVLIVSADVIVLTMLRRGRAIFRRGRPRLPRRRAAARQEAEAA